jgi:hypothetical protein
MWVWIEGEREEGRKEREEGMSDRVREFESVDK